MITVALTLGYENQPERIEVELDLHAGYTNDAAIACELLGLALTAEIPIVVDSEGEVLALPPGSVRAFVVRNAGP